VGVLTYSLQSDFESITLRLFVVSPLTCLPMRVDAIKVRGASVSRVAGSEVAHCKETAPLEPISVFLYGVDICRCASIVLPCYEMVVRLGYHSLSSLIEIN
jgi:hypothetical protein